MSSAGRSGYSIVDKIRQSPSLDLKATVNDAWIGQKTIVITGGASGFGAGFFKRWAATGATVIIGDVSVKKGEKLVLETKTSTGNGNLYFFHCDVTNWQSQVDFFKAAVKISPHGGIDCVVANAGISDPNETFEYPKGIEAAEPLPPDLKVLDVNLKGVLYTAHLALYYLPRNPGSVPSSPDCDPTTLKRDRHLLIMASSAGLLALPMQTMYSISKHGCVGLFRNLQISSFQQGIRTSMICPYFIDTPIINTLGRVVLAGGCTGKLEDVVEAGTRFVSDPRIVGRAVFVGPKLNLKKEDDGQWVLVNKNAQDDGAEETATIEIYGHDAEEVELFTRNSVSLLNAATALRGWTGWGRDIIAAIRHALGW